MIYFAFQAFREVFEYLINDFKTYRPLLSLIKNEYEKLIEHQREKIRELEPLQVRHVSILKLSLLNDLFSRNYLKPPEEKKAMIVKFSSVQFI